MCYLFTFAFIVVDYITGLIKAFYTASFRSHIMRQGLWHKASLLCLMALGVLMDYAQHYIDLGVTVPVGGAACVYIAMMEAGSALENLCAVNPELVPDKLYQILGAQSRKEASENGDSHRNNDSGDAR